MQRGDLLYKAPILWRAADPSQAPTIKPSKIEKKRLFTTMRGADYLQSLASYFFTVAGEGPASAFELRLVREGPQSLAGSAFELLGLGMKT